MRTTPQTLDDIQAILEQIKTEIAGWGRNFAPIPIAMSLEGDSWHIFVDVRSTPMRAFDFEICNPILKEALQRTLTQVRREMK